MMDEDGTKMVTGLPPLAAAPPPPDEEGGETKARADTCKTRLDAEDIVLVCFGWYGASMVVNKAHFGLEKCVPLTVIVASKPL